MTNNAQTGWAISRDKTEMTETYSTFSRKALLLIKDYGGSICEGNYPMLGQKLNIPLL
jgi:hypothetical protein